ncbi:hypothetical protein [Bilophila wadsworthia]|uniref:hypothetical protein n=2 Tax=Bilophila wadsworthia TaxID=35833 RepID=UPI00307C650A
MKRRANKRNISSLFVGFLGGIASSLLISYFDYKKEIFIYHKEYSIDYSNNQNKIVNELKCLYNRFNILCGYFVKNGLSGYNADISYYIESIEDIVNSIDEILNTKNNYIPHGIYNQLIDISYISHQYVAKIKIFYKQYGNIEELIPEIQEFSKVISFTSLRLFVFRFNPELATKVTFNKEELETLRKYSLVYSKKENSDSLGTMF